MFGDDREGPELHVPAEALRKPKGAAIAEDGTVACVACGNRIPLAKADVVGQGYRCAPCSHQAEIANLERGITVDAGAHLSKGLREELILTGTMMQLGGVALLVVGIALIVALFDTDGMKLGGFVAAAGAGLMITGSMKKSAAGH
jgi:DNA-directed RNA polymerase subunit RPC12/RpoP